MTHNCNDFPQFLQQAIGNDQKQGCCRYIIIPLPHEIIQERSRKTGNLSNQLRIRALAPGYFQ
jgi:hypothetical protein